MRIPDSKAMAKAARVREYERTHHCTDEWHRHFHGLIYTDGIKFVAETCGAYWLIDAVASHQPIVRAKLEQHGLRPFQVWRLLKLESDDAWILDAWSDTPEYAGGDEGPASVLLVEQNFGYTDFPESLSPFEFWVEGETALLKAGH